MPDLEISNLPALAEAGIAATDPLAIADISASETKKVTVKDLIEAGVALIDSASIPAAKVGALGTGQVATGAIVDGAVTNAKLANSSVSLGGVSISLGGTDATPAFNLADATGYTTANLSGTISSAQLAGSIANSKLANSSVSLGGISVSLGGTDATPAFNLTDATGYKTTELVGTITNAQLAGSIDVSKLVGSTVSFGGVSVAIGGTDATPAFNLTDATGYPTSSLVGTITSAQLAGSIANAKLANSSVNFGGVSVALGASDATPAFDLTDATNYPASSLTGTITNAQLAGSIAVSKLVSSSVSLGGVSISLGTTDATPAFDLQDATGYPTSALVGTITNAQLAGSIAATKLVSGSITSTQLAANSVTDSELANNAVDTGAVQNGAITNDKVETSTSATTGLDGATKIRDASITPAKLNTSNLDRSLNVASGNLGINNVITAATRSGFTYNAQGLITGTVALAAADLPVATSSAVGGVSVGTGLSVSGAGALSITNSITAASISGITYNAQGQITSTTALVAADLPVATTSAKGAVQITSGGGLTVDGSGNLTTSTSGVSAGTYQSVTVNNKGVITAGAALTSGLIPSLPASKITSGSIDAARIGTDSIDGTKLSNSSTAVFQSIAQSGYPTAQFSGQILFDTVSEDAFIWDGNAWQAITTLTKGSLVFGGNFNANTSKMTATTTAGIAAGLAVGSNLPSPSANTDGVYVVVDTAGTPSAPAPVVAFSPPDYILGVTNSSGSSWNEIDLSQTVAGQIAGNITFTPYGQLSATNVQDALQELETEKLALAGGTVTGQVLIGNTGSLVFEGSTVDAYETTLTVADPTSSDKTITFPDTTGTVITTGDTGTVTGTMLANGTIQNVDIHADAAIAFTKLADLTSAQILVGNGSNEPTAVAVTGDISINNAGLTAIAAGVIVDADVSNSAQITGSKVVTGTTSAVGVLQLTDSASSTSATTAATPAAVKIAKDAADAAATTANAALPKAGGTMTDHLIIDNGKELRLSESDGDGTNYTGLKAQAQSGDITLTLPAVAPTANQVLKADASTPTTLTWAADSATDVTKMPLAGGTFTGDVTFTGDASDGLWDKSASAFVANLTGNVTGNASGSSGSCTGNAATATALATARNIGGVSFDGTASINLPGVNATGTQDTSGNAATATKFASSVNIGGVAFDGSASINLPGVNASGTQDTSGTAALATQFTVTANNSTDETVYPLFTDGATGSQGAETDTGLTYNPSTGLLTSTSLAGNLTGNVTGNVTGNCSGTSGGFTAGNASNLNSGTVNVARLGSGSSVTTKFLRGDNTWQTISATPEGTAILSTGESGGTKFLREDGDGTCSWQTVDLTALSASNLTSGTVPDARFPATLPAASGANLTALNASNIASGTIAAARVPTLNQDTTGNAASADTVDVSAIGTNATYYPIFTDNDGSAKTLGVDSGISYNPSTNVLTAGTFSGSLTGNVTGNVSGSAATVTGAAQSAITSVGTLTGLTIASATGQMLTLNSTDGNDATLAWQRSGSRVGYIGYASTTNNHIYLKNEIDGGDMYFQTNESGTTRTQMVIGAAVNLYYEDGDRKFRTNSTGAIVENANGDAYLQVVAETDAAGNNAYLRLKTNNTTNGYSVIEFGDTADTNVGRIQYYHPDDKFQFLTNATVALTIDSSQNATFTGSQLNLENPTSGGEARLLLKAGNTGEAYILFNADKGDNQSDKWKVTAPDGGPLAIQYDDGNWENALTATKDGAVTLFHDDSARLATSNAGVTITGVCTATSFSGDGSNLTNLPASGGTITATASGSIAAHKPVHVNANGTVQVPTIGDPIFGSAANVGTTSTGSHNITYDTDNDCLVAVFTASSVAWVRVGVISGTTVSWSAAVNCTDSGKTTAFADIVYEKGQGEVWVIFSQSNSPYRMLGSKITIANNTPTAAANVTVSSNNFSGHSVRICQGADNFIEIATQDSSNNSVAARYRVNGGLYDQAQLENNCSSGSTHREEVVYDPDTGSTTWFWMKANNLKYRTAGSGNSISFDISATVLKAGSCKNIAATYNSTADRVIVAYALSSKCYLVAGAVQGNGTITWGTHFELQGSGEYENQGVDLAHNVELGKTYIVYDYSGFNRILWGAISVSGSTITVPDGGQLDSAQGGLKPAVTYNPDNFTQTAIWRYTDGNLRTITRSGPSTSVTDENFIGFADGTSYTNGQTVTVKVVSSTTTQSSLTPGQKYYVQGDGTIALTAGTPSVYAGVALTSTSLLVKG